jgi:hypothetical protein
MHQVKQQYMQMMIVCECSNDSNASWLEKWSTNTCIILLRRKPGSPCLDSLERRELPDTDKRNKQQSKTTAPITKHQTTDSSLASLKRTVALQLRTLCIIDYALLAASKIPPSCHSAKCVNVSWYLLNAVFGVEPFFIQTNGLSKALK